MPRLYGRDYTRAGLARHFGNSSQVFGVRLLTCADGAERDVRVLQFRTGSGLSFEVLVDRCMDLGSMEYRGAALGFQSPTGFRSPYLHEVDAEGGLGFLRSFSGLLNTCGLDHVMGPASEPAEHYNYPHRKTVFHGLHGRVSFVPARLAGYGERWEGDRCFLWAEGEIVQAAMFAENLHLVRRVESEVGTSTVTLRDRVESRGYYPTPHAILYHVNLAWPLVAEGSVLAAPITRMAWTAHDSGATTIGHAVQAAPQSRFREQVYEHEMAADSSGLVPVAMLNRAFAWGGGRTGLGFLMEYRRDQLPAFYQWQNLQEGNYVVGIEPCTIHAGSREDWKSRGELRWLEHGQACDYALTFSVLDGTEDIDRVERRIAGIGPGAPS